MPSKKPPTPACDELRTAFDTFMAKPPTSNVHWDRMFATIEKALAAATSKNAAAEVDGITKLKAEARRAREAWNEGQNTR